MNTSKQTNTKRYESHTQLPFSDLETQRSIGGGRAFTLKVWVVGESSIIKPMTAFTQTASPTLTHTPNYHVI